jgi:hypothetical protein
MAWEAIIMEAVTLLELQKMVNKAKYVYVFCHAVDTQIEVKKGHLKEIIKNQMINKNIDLNFPYCLAELDDDELWIDQL